MQRILSRILMVLVVLWIICAETRAGQIGSARTLRASLIQVEPYGFLTEDGEVTGIHYDLVKGLAEAVGLSLEVELAPFARVLMRIQRGDADLTLMYCNESIDQSAVVVGTFSLARNVVFGRPGTAYTSLEDLHGRVVANIRGANYDDAFMADEAIKKYWTKDYRQSLKMFLRKRVDAIVAPESGILYAAKKMGLGSDIFGDPLVLIEKEAYLFFSKKTADGKTVADLKNALGRLKEQGEIKKIYARYLKPSQKMGEF